MKSNVTIFNEERNFADVFANFLKNGASLEDVLSTMYVTAKYGTIFIEHLKEL